jgi:putative serine/threonine protein kinase
MEVNKMNLNQPKKLLVVSIEQLKQEPYSSVLCFPRYDEVELDRRIEELRNHNIEALEFSGPTNIFGVRIPVLGKGFVGIVVIAHVKSQREALKILRLDGGRADLLHEASMLSKANSVAVGPRLISASKRFLLMQLIEGKLLPDWLEANDEPATIRKVLNETLEQCFRLDQVGLDHGELSKAPKHLLVDNAEKVFIVDFETASLNRNASNVTSVCQFLFQSNSTSSKIIVRKLKKTDKEKLIETLKNYKKERTRGNFEAILKWVLE